MTMAAGATAAAPETARPAAEATANGTGTGTGTDAQAPVVSTTHEVNGSVYSNWNVKNMPPRNPPQSAPEPATATPEPAKQHKDAA
jgi:hypothetical protein